MKTKLSARPGYRWVVMASCFLMVMVCLGFSSSTKGLYLSAVTEALKLERSLYSIHESLRYVATAVVNLFFGSLIIRFGPRKLIAGGFLCLVAAMLLFSAAESLPAIYLAGALLGIGQSWNSTTIVGYVVGLWCRENKGTIMGAILAANGVGSAIAAQIISPFINGSTFGYRTAYQITAVILLVTGAVVVLLFRDRPEGQTIAAPVGKKVKARGWTGLTLQQCLKKPYFYAMLVWVFVMGLVIQSSSGIYPSHMKDVGLDPAWVTTVVSVYSLLLTGTKFLTGVCYDRLGLHIMLLITGIASTAAMLVLALLGPQVPGMAMAYGILYAIGVPVQTVAMPLVTAEMFGDMDSARILGVLVSVSTVGYAVGTPLVNLFYDLQGTYQTVLLLLGGMMAAVTVLCLLCLNAAQKLRKQMEQTIE